MPSQPQTFSAKASTGSETTDHSCGSGRFDRQNAQPAMRERVRGFVESDPFKLAIMIIVVVNSVIVGVQTAQLPTGVSWTLNAIDVVFLVVYTAEAILKIYALGAGYFRDPWNVFDFLILLLCVASSAFVPIPAQAARVLRVFRVVRALRLVTAFKEMRIIVEAIGRSIPSVCWTALLLTVIMYVYAVIGTSLFGREFPDLFGNLGASLFTLFQTMTLEGWSGDVARPVMEVFPISWVYFVSFVVIAAFVALNVVVGIVVNTIEETQRNARNQEVLEGGSDLQREFLALREQLNRVEALIESDSGR